MCNDYAVHGEIIVALGEAKLMKYQFYTRKLFISELTNSKNSKIISKLCVNIIHTIIDITFFHKITMQHPKLLYDM